MCRHMARTDMTIFYHYTTPERLREILQYGIRPGRETGHGERLPFVMASSKIADYQPRQGAAFIRFTLDESDPALHHVNSHWIEYYGSISPDRFTGYLLAPQTNAEVIEILQEGGESALSDAFSWKSL